MWYNKTTADSDEGGGPIRGLNGPKEGIFCLGLGVVHGDTGGIRSQAADITPPLQILGGPHHGSHGRSLI